MSSASLKLLGGFVYGGMTVAASVVAAYQNSLEDLVGTGERIIAGGVILAAGTFALLWLVRVANRNEKSMQAIVNELQDENRRLQARNKELEDANSVLRGETKDRRSN